MNKLLHNLAQASIGLILIGLLVALPRPAQALPVLQMFIEGARYDQDTESWITSSSDLTLWVIGNTGQHGSILDVQLTAAVLTGETGTISVSPTATTLLPDPSVSATPILNTSVGADGTTPIMSNGDDLPSHGIYGAGVSFMQWGLGDMTLTDSQIGDFSGTFPTTLSGTGQINAYNISISGYSMVHFDAFNHVEAPSHVFFGPFSHDTTVVPEPGSILLLGLGLVGGLGWRLRRKGSSRRKQDQ